MTQRIKGQEVFLSIQVDGELQARIDSIQSAEFEFEQELIEEDYLGETNSRFDTIFKGVMVEIEGHSSNQDILLLIQAITDRSQRRAGAPVRIDVGGSFAFPNGDFPTIVVQDVFFENMPISVGGREEYVSYTLSGKGGSYQIVV